MASEMVIIGKILAPFGVHGEVKVLPYSDHLERCYLLDQVKIEGIAGDAYKRVRRARIHKQMWLLQFADCHTRQEASRLRDSLVKIDASERLPLPAGRYYFDQIIGLEVYTVDGRYLGRVQEILQPGGNDVYRVARDPHHTGFLIPALKNVVKKISPAERRMIIEPLPGLLD